MAFFRELVKTEQSIKHLYAPHHPGEPILKVTDLTVEYESGLALQNVSFQIPRANRVAILGPNGAGKSTLLKVIAGVLPATSGSVEIFGEKPDQHICIAYVPQRSQVDWNFPVRVRDVVMMGRISKLGLFHRASRQDWKTVEKALEVVNLANLSNRQISELSGGQQQRMFIARALAQEAELMLMDEPLTGLDVSAQEDIFHILDQLRQQQVTVLLALHDLKLASEQAEMVMLLNHRLIGFGSPNEVFQNENLVSAYGSRRVTRSFDDVENPWLGMDDTCCAEGNHSHD
jgi:ABC-type Mn2+/Zn2+ transport system ATPase subunit